MKIPVALIVCAAFIVLAMWHFYMALLPRAGRSAAVPAVDGKPLFVPSRTATVAVGIALLLFAGLVAATSGVIATDISPKVLRWLSCGLAAGLLARAVGDFKYVGMFKRVRGTRFATLDTTVYSPLCMLLCIGVGFVALHDGV